MKSLIAMLGVLVLLAGCASNGESDAPTFQPVRDDDLVSRSYEAAEALLAQVPWIRDNRQPLLTGTFVNINSLENSSALGRIVAEQISSRFAQDGFTMVEMKLRQNVFIQQNGGEFVLSREVRNLSRVHNAQAVIAGTYAVGRRNVYVTARLIRAADNLVLAAYDYSMPLGPDAKALLASQ
ncbi:MAG: FlgO family outer membrane protein [Candidatus Competibacterales bacterium]|nr:FlgO family outer membrane protein [Candidatus Competibacterales bacterium]